MAHQEVPTWQHIVFTLYGACYSLWVDRGVVWDDVGEVLKRAAMLVRGLQDKPTQGGSIPSPLTKHPIIGAEDPATVTSLHANLGIGGKALRRPEDEVNEDH